MCMHGIGCDRFNRFQKLWKIDLQTGLIYSADEPKWCNCFLCSASVFSFIVE